MGNQPASSEPYYQIDDTLIAPSQTPLDQHLQRLEQLCRLYVITAPSNTPLIEEILAQVKTITDQDLHTYFNEYSDITNQRQLSPLLMQDLMSLVENKTVCLMRVFELLSYGKFSSAEVNAVPRLRELKPDLFYTSKLLQSGLLMHNQKQWLLSNLSQLAMKLITDKELVSRFNADSDYFKQFTDEIRPRVMDHSDTIILKSEAAIDQFWLQTIQSYDDFKQAVLVSLLALGQLCTRGHLVKKSALQASTFLPQILSLLRSSNDEQVVLVLLQVLSYRLQSSKYSDTDIHFYFITQITQNEDDQFVSDESFLLESLRQVLELSDEGPLKPEMARNYKVQVAVHKLLNLSLQAQSNSISRSPKSKYFRRQWHMLQMAALTEDSSGGVLKHQIAFLQRIMAIEKNKLGEVESQQLLGQVEYLLNVWTQRLGQQIYCASGVEVGLDAKVYMITQLVKFFVNKSHFQRETEWGARTLEHKIVDIVIRQTMPQVQGHNLDSILFSLIYLLSEMIDNEPNLIKVLFQTDVISMVITLLQTHKYDFNVQKTALPPYHDYFKILTKFLGRLVLTQHGQATVTEHGVSILKPILDQVTRLRPHDSEFFEVDVARQRLFQIKPVRDLIKTFLVECIESAQLMASQFDSKYQANMVKFKSKQLVNFMMQADELPLQATLRCLHIKDARMKRQHDFRPQQANLEQTITQLICDTADPVLQQRTDLVQLIETLVGIDQPVGNLINLVKTLLNETPSAPEGELSANVKLIEQNIKSSIHEFAQSTNLMTLSDLDHFPRDKLQKLLLYTQNQFISRERDAIKNWSSEIPILLQIARLVCKKWFDTTIKIVLDPALVQNFKKLQKALKVTDIQSYVGLVKSLEQTHLIIRKQGIKEFGIQTFDSDDFPFYILHSINRLDERQRDPIPHERNFENKSLLTLGEELAHLATKLDTKAGDDLLKWCCYNEPLIQVLGVFTLNDKMYGQLHIGFVYRNGLVFLCRLYKELNKVQHLDSPQNTSQVLTQAIIWAQKEGVAKIIMAFIHLKEKRRHQLQQYSCVKIADYTRDVFSNLRHFAVNQYHQLFTELLNYTNPDEPSLALQAKEPNYDLLVEFVLKAFSMQAWKYLDQSETHSHRMFGAFEREFNRNTRSVQEDREVSATELEWLEAMGFTDQHRSAMALRMANFDPSRAINILIDQEPRLDRYIQEQELKQRQQQRKVLVVSDVQMPFDTITIEAFESNVSAYNLTCLKLLLRSTDKTAVDSETALKIIKKLKLKSDVWNELFSELKRNPSLHIIKVALLVLQQHRPDKMIPFTELAAVVEQVKDDQESLHFLLLFINKTGDFQPDLLNQAKSLFKSLLDAPEVHRLTKETVLATVYQLITKTQEYESSIAFISPHDSKFMLQLYRLALFNPVTIKTTFKNQLMQIFQVQHDYKQKLLKSIHKSSEDPCGLATVGYRDLIKPLLAICQDKEIVKDVLVQNCTLQKTSMSVMVRPKEIPFVIDTCEIQPNERQVMDLLLADITVAHLIQAAKWTQIFPHLLPLFQRPTYEAFSKTLTGVLFDNKIGEPQLQELFTNLLGYNQFTPNILERQQIRSALILHLNEQLPCEPIEVLKIVKVLINYNNNHEFNRALLSPQFYYHNIEFIVVETTMVQSMCGLVTSWTQANQAEGLQLLIDIIQMFCVHAEQVMSQQNKQQDSEPDEEQGEDMQDEYDQEQFDENDQSSSYYDDEDDHSQRADILRRPPTAARRQESQTIEIRAGGMDGIFYHPSRLETVRFTNAWTEQESQAQAILQMLYLTLNDPQQDQQDPRPFATCFMCGQQGHFTRNCPTQQDRASQPPTTQFIKTQQDSFQNNKMSFKYECLKPLQKLEILKILADNVKAINLQFKEFHKKEAPIQFRTYSRSADSVGRDSFLPFALRQHFNSVLDLGGDDLQERLRQFDTHVTMLLDRNDRDRFFMNSGEEAKDDDPIDLVGSLVGPPSESQSALQETLLTLLPISVQPQQPPRFAEIPRIPPFSSIDNVRGDIVERLPEEPMQRPPIVRQISSSSEEEIIDDVEMAEQDNVQMTFGYPNSVLIENNIDPTMLQDLPEQVRIELLSTVNWQARPIMEVNQVVQQTSEEAKEVDLFLDMPQEIRDELALNERQAAQIQPPVVQQQSDIDEIQTLLATVIDPQIRTEMLIGLSSATVELLPPHLRDEARRLRNRQNLDLGHQVMSRQEMLGRLQTVSELQPFPAFGSRYPMMLPNVSDMMRMHWINDDQRQPDDTITKDQPKTLEDVELLSLTPDQCYFKLVVGSELYVIRSESSIADLIEQIDSQAESTLLCQLLKYLEFLASSETPKVKLNLIPLLNSLSAITAKGINRLTDCLVEGYKSNFNQSAKQVPCLLFMSILRVIAQLNKKLGVQIVSDFVFAANKDNNAIKVLFEHLKLIHTGMLDETARPAFSKNIQSSLQDLISCHDQIKWDKLKTVPECTIVALTEILEMSITDQSLVQQISKLLLKISKQKQTHLQMIIQLCSEKQQKSQKDIVQGLSKVLQQHFNQDQEDDAMSQQSLSLHFQMSQQSQPETQVAKITSDQLSGLEQSLKLTSNDLTCLRHISHVISVIKPQAQEKAKSGVKNQIHMLNEVLQIVKNQKQIRPAILAVLKAHVACIFEVNLPELNKISASFDKSDTKIRMQSLTLVQKPSNKVKMAAAVFKNVVEVSDQLYEFCKFALINKDIINRMVVIPELFTLSTFIKAMPNILNFENKRAYFKKEIEKIKKSHIRMSDISLRVKRKDIFMETYAQLGHKPVEALWGKLTVNFVGEAGSDLGGLSRDFFVELSRAMFNPHYSLFKLSSNGVTYYPNVHSSVNPNHLNFFKFIGRMIGKALFDGQLLECYFSKPLYKMMVGDELTFEDQKDLDDDAYRGLKWTLNNDIEGQEMYFSVDSDFFGKIESKELVPGGQDMKVTNENKLEYLDKLGYFKMYTMIQEQVDHFLAGFYELIPKQLVGIFSHHELELLISGLPDFNLADLKANTEYEGYTPESDHVLWLWQILAHASKEEIARFLQFVTGSSRIPLEGFKALQGNEGIEKFKIKRTFDTQKLPESHTCFNSLDLPEYATKEIMKEKLLFAINETNDFGQL